MTFLFFLDPKYDYEAANQSRYWQPYVETYKRKRKKEFKIVRQGREAIAEPLSLTSFARAIERANAIRRNEEILLHLMMQGEL